MVKYSTLNSGAANAEDKMLTMSPKEKERWERTLRKNSPDNIFAEDKVAQVVSKTKEALKPSLQKRASELALVLQLL